MVNGIGLTDNYMKIEQDDTPGPLVNSIYWQCETWRGDKEVITSSNDERGKSDEETV